VAKAGEAPRGHGDQVGAGKEPLRTLSEQVRPPPGRHGASGNLRVAVVSHRTLFEPFRGATCGSIGSDGRVFNAAAVARASNVLFFQVTGFGDQQSVELHL
jgi:hypothetical protein